MQTQSYHSSCNSSAAPTCHITPVTISTCVHTSSLPSCLQFTCNFWVLSFLFVLFVPPPHGELPQKRQKAVLDEPPLLTATRRAAASIWSLLKSRTRLKCHRQCKLQIQRLIVFVTVGDSWGAKTCDNSASTAASCSWGAACFCTRCRLVYSPASLRLTDFCSSSPSPTPTPTPISRVGLDHVELYDCVGMNF